MAQKKNKASKRKRQQRHERRPARTKRGDEKVDTQERPTEAEWGEVVQHFYRRRRRQKIWGGVLAILGVITILNHFFEHTDTANVLGAVLSSGAQDLVAGFPMGLAMIGGAAILFGQLDEPPKRTTVTRRRRTR